MSRLELVRDFVNTADLEGGEDSLAEWLRAHDADSTPRAVRDARAVREALRTLALANNGVDVDAAGAAVVLDAAARRRGVGFRFGSGGFASEDHVGAILAAASAAMAAGEWERLKACRSDTCRWAFVDTARNRSRRWCAMAVCGNRAKARAYRRRQIAST
jgi:predicted RNA-binding Zn ribbon-like protein